MSKLRYGPDGLVDLTGLSPREQADAIAEDIARDCVEKMSTPEFVLHYERHGNSFIIYENGIPTNEIEISEIH